LFRADQAFAKGFGSGVAQWGLAELAELVAQALSLVIGGVSPPGLAGELVVMHHLAIAADSLCLLLQRRLGRLDKCVLNTLRWQLFGRAAVWSRARGKATLKLAVRGLVTRH
jgi:hypothetical protein